MAATIGILPEFYPQKGSFTAFVKRYRRGNLRNPQEPRGACPAEGKTFDQIVKTLRTILSPDD